MLRILSLKVALVVKNGQYIGWTVCHNQLFILNSVKAWLTSVDQYWSKVCCVIFEIRR